MGGSSLMVVIAGRQGRASRGLEERRRGESFSALCRRIYVDRRSMRPFTFRAFRAAMGSSPLLEPLDKVPHGTIATAKPETVCTD